MWCKIADQINPKSGNNLPPVFSVFLEIGSPCGIDVVFDKARNYGSSKVCA